MYGKARRYVLRTDDDGFLDCDGCLFGIFCRCEEIEQKRLTDLLQDFSDRMINVSKRGAREGGMVRMKDLPLSGWYRILYAVLRSFVMALFAYWGTR